MIATIAEVLKSKKTNRPLTDTFERDWQKAISGKEFVNRTHEHIEEWWNANRH